ncbi:hypothetical protein ATCC90586_002679 [Pythium insidiosum]|nr:hypothetical protein ATCC90586_002679 [Pythium insidiosum]
MPHRRLELEPLGDSVSSFDALALTPSASPDVFGQCSTPSQLRQRFIQIQVVDQRFKQPSWMHPNIGGEAQHLAAPEDELQRLRRQLADDPQRHALGEWPATALSGNDILSSVLFTVGLTLPRAGKLAPLAQLLVVVVVFCFRRVLEEVMSAVPLNGGCYNALLNASSKRVATVAAAFSLLSYLATGVVCGVSAFQYLNALVAVPVVWSTIAMLLVFALLCVVGIAESAVVALAFFLFHAATLVVLCIACVVFAVQHPSILWDNLRAPLPDVSVLGAAVDSNVALALFMGFGPALLSVTGFESSAQFVEEQAPGVFPKTLRNMWALSSAFNMAITALALAVVPLADVEGNQEVLLAHMGFVAAGRWLEIVVIVDAFLVLSGAVLTAYVGINGLVQRLAIDRVLPRVLLRKNAWRDTTHFIILAYFLVASSLVLALNGRTSALAGVFAFAFLGVLASFAVGCLLLKIHRDEIPRETTTSWSNVLFCLVMTLVGVVSNALGDATALAYFAIYLGGIGGVILLMLERVRILTSLLYVSKQLMIYLQYERRGREPPQPPRNLARTTNKARGHGVIGSVLVAKTIEAIKQTPVIFFCKAANLPKINEAIAYVMQNEQTYCLRLVHMCDGEMDTPREFEDVVCLFDHIYPSIKIDFVSLAGAFEPAMIEWIATTMDIPTNMMFMRQPAREETHRIAALGVRIITN